MIRSLAIVAALCLCGASAKAELTMQECRAKYKAEQAAGKLGQNWADFQEKKCGHPPHRPKSKKIGR
jgi:hypothetical protein